MNQINIPVIEVEDFSKNYGEFTAVRSLSFAVQRGEIVGLVGANGAGKTTTLRAITGILRPTRGTIHVGGFDIERAYGRFGIHKVLHGARKIRKFLAVIAGGFGTGGSIGDYGRPLNPHNHEHVTGGSSSGSGAAVAAGQVDISFGGDQGGSIRIPAAFCGIIGHKPTFGLVSHFGIGFGSDQSIDYTGPMARTVEDAAAALQATAGHDPYDPRATRDVPNRMDVLGRLAEGVGRVRIGVLQEGFDDAEGDVRDLVLAAVDVLAKAGADVTKISIPAHHAIRAAQAALAGEGALALFKTGFFGAFTRTYYPAPLIAAINKLWASQADVLAPRTKLSLIAAELSRRNYHGGVYAKAQNVRPAYIKAYDAALADVDVLVMPTCIMTAPKNHKPGSYLEAVEDNLMSASRGGNRNTLPFNYTGHPALALPVGKSSAGLPVSMQLVGHFFDDPLLMRVAHAYQHATDWGKIIGVHA